MQDHQVELTIKLIKTLIKTAAQYYIAEHEENSDIEAYNARMNNAKEAYDMFQSISVQLTQAQIQVFGRELQRIVRNFRIVTDGGDIYGESHTIFPMSA